MRLASLEDRHRAAEHRDVVRCIGEPWPFTWTPPGPRWLTEDERRQIASDYGNSWWHQW